MNINYVDTGRGEILQIDGAEIMFKNFSGRPTIYDREGGDRNFCLRIDDEDIANELISRGWNVKIKPARDPQEPPLMFMKVKVKFNNNGPNIYLVSGGAKAKLDEDSVSVLDNAYLLFTKVKIKTAELAEVENSIYRLATAIKKTQKRANALKNILIPKFEGIAKYITDSLEEIGFFSKTGKKDMALFWRNLLSRSALSESEAKYIEMVFNKAAGFSKKNGNLN